MRQAVLYGRYSPRPCAEECGSVKKQLERCRAYCAGHGYTVVVEHHDKDLSGGRADNRPGLQETIATASARKAVLVGSPAPGVLDRRRRFCPFLGPAHDPANPGHLVEDGEEQGPSRAHARSTSRARASGPSPGRSTGQASAAAVAAGHIRPCGLCYAGPASSQKRPERARSWDKFRTATQEAGEYEAPQPLPFPSCQPLAGAFWSVEVSHEAIRGTPTRQNANTALWTAECPPLSQALRSP
jgi:hypothetical protein